MASEVRRKSQLYTSKEAKLKLNARLLQRADNKLNNDDQNEESIRNNAKNTIDNDDMIKLNNAKKQADIR